MNETGGTRRRRANFWLGCASLPLIYFASYFGTGVLLHCLHYPDLPVWLDITFEVVYYPLNCARDEWDWLGEAMEWILNLTPFPLPEPCGMWLPGHA